MTAEEAMERALDWAEGRRSWTNLGPDAPYTPDVIAVMDAQEVVKWTAVAAALTTSAPDQSVDPERAAQVIGELLDTSPGSRGPRLTAEGDRLSAWIAGRLDYGNPGAVMADVAALLIHTGVLGRKNAGLSTADAALERVLSEVEWNGYSFVGVNPCPSCGGEEPRHAADCSLAAALSEVGS